MSPGARFGIGSLSVGALMLIWGVLAENSLPAILPGPLRVLSALWGLLADGAFWRAVMAPSLLRSAAGVFLALVLGGVLGVISQRFALISAVLAPYRVMLMGLPAPILAILCILWFDGGTVTVIVCITLLLMPVFQIATTEGLNAVDPQLSEMAQIFKIPAMRRLRHIVWPALWVALGPAFRTSVANGLRITLLTELLSGAEGLGQAVMTAQSYLQTDRLFALVLIILGLLAGIEAIVNQLTGKARR
ncbi:ABC transporter permease [Celeribacter sp. ULVN23_4]